MAKRDMVKTAKQITAKIDPHYDMTFDDMQLTYNIIKNGKPAEGIALAFRYGYAMGRRATVKGTYKESKKGGKK